LVIEHLPGRAKRAPARPVHVLPVTGAVRQRQTRVVTVIVGTDRALQTGVQNGVVEKLVGNVAPVHATVRRVLLIKITLGNAAIGAAIVGTLGAITLKCTGVVGGGSHAIQLFPGMYFHVVQGTGKLPIGTDGFHLFPGFARGISGRYLGHHIVTSTPGGLHTFTLSRGIREP